MVSAFDLTVRQVMNPNPIRLGPDSPIQDALERMNGQRVGSVLIVEGERLVGIFTERDFLKRTTAAVPGWRTLPLRDWMSPTPYTIDPNATWEEAAMSMQRLRVRHLPVVEEGRVIGIVSARQLIARRAEHLNLLVGERTQELRQANEQLLARDSEVTYYMKVAARLQQRLVLPAAPPQWPELTWGVHYAPLDPLGGDYYDFAQPSPDHLGILIADASGHGIPAAMVAIMARLAFREMAERTTQPGDVLAAMNRRLADLTDERFVTAFYGVLDRQTMRLTCANAGHPFPFRYVARTRTVEPLSARGLLLGIDPDEVYREREVELMPGDRLCLFTDGVTDCRNAIGESFGLERIAAAIAPNGKADRILLGGLLIDRLSEFRGDTKPCDDMTLVMAEVHRRE
jgi:phosphoserine phosphatase RsbU/P